MGYTLVNDGIRHFCQTINVGFACTIVTTFDCIVEKTVYGVTVILIVLSCIDTTLCSNRVSTTGRILDTEVEYSESHFAQRSGCRCAGKSGTYNDNVKTTFVGRIYKFLVSFIVTPFFG